MATTSGTPVGRARIKACGTHEAARPHEAARGGWLGYAGLGWALSFIPVHVYWALGGTLPAIGITASIPSFRAANWGASLVILGGGLTCLALTRRWGEPLPRALRHGAAWVGGIFGITHWLAFSVLAAAHLAGLTGYPSGTALSVGQMRAYDWANLVYFEPWFAVMGALLIGCSLRARRRRPGSPADGSTPDGSTADGSTAGRPAAPPAWMLRAGWARPASVAVLGLTAAASAAWAAGSGMLAGQQAAGAPLRLLDLGQAGQFRPVPAVAAAMLAAVAVAVCRRWPGVARRGGSAVTLAGLLAVIWGVFTFDAWTFAGYGPALMAAGLLSLLAGTRDLPGGTR